MFDPQAGDTFVFARTFGIGPGSIPDGTTVKVTDVLSDSVPGIGGDGDRLVLLVEQPSTVVDENGNPQEGVSSRLVGMTVADLKALVETDNGG